MEFPSINPKFLETAVKTAGYRAANLVASRLSAGAVKKIQQLFQAGNFIDGLLGLSGNTEDAAQPLLGGLSLAEARAIHDELRAAQLARKNLFAINISDANPPGGGAANFNLFAIDASYSPCTLTGEKISIGSASMDKLTGSEAAELSITTMDDSVGTLKRWFDAKHAQAAHPDGTFGLPNDYLVSIEIFHATPTANANAYRFNAMMRTVAITHELSRREQAMQELQMTFTQFDTFSGVA